MDIVLEPLAPPQAVLYRYLAEGFSLPDRARLEYLHSMVGTAQAAAEELLETGEASGALPDLAGLEEAIREARSSPLGELQAEYTRLFVFGMPATPCRLVEAVQREGMLVGEASEAVAELYGRFGLTVQDREPDHLTAELEFLAYLAGTPVAAGREAERYRRAGRKFLREHLLRWGPDLTAKIRAATAERLYRSLAEVLAWTLQLAG